MSEKSSTFHSAREQRYSIFIKIAKKTHFFLLIPKNLRTFAAFFRFLGIQYAEVCYFRRFLPETLHVA